MKLEWVGGSCTTSLRLRLATGNLLYTSDFALSLTFFPPLLKPPKLCQFSNQEINILFKIIAPSPSFPASQKY